MTSTISCPDTSIDFADPEVWAGGAPLEVLARIRDTEGLWWNTEKPTSRSGFTDGGFWFATRHADVTAISRDPELFAAGPNTALPWYGTEMTPESRELNQSVLLNMDGEKHAKTRRIVQRGFTKRAVDKMADALAVRAHQIVADAAAQGGIGDFVADVAGQLPMAAMADLLGVDESERAALFAACDTIVSGGDSGLEAVPSAAKVMGIAWDLAEDRQKCPANDIVTTLINAEIDGESLTQAEFALFVVTLAVAGTETTRSSIAQGMRAFVHHRDQWELYRRERPRTAVDEILRFVSPVSMMQRTATRDTEMSGTSIAAGQRVVMCFTAANFDPMVFDDPEVFDISRSRNPHTTFGAGGNHHCVGANLARLELDLMFGALAEAMPTLAEVAAPTRARTPWLNSVASWPVAYTTATPVFAL